MRRRPGHCGREPRCSSSSCRPGGAARRHCIASQPASQPASQLVGGHIAKLEANHVTARAVPPRP
eukprot:1647479-Rhodomonas_salina.1